MLTAKLLTLTGCASTNALEWLRDEHADAIAEDLAIAFAMRLPPNKTPIFVADMPLRDHFERAVRTYGYAVAATPDEAIGISGLGERIPPNTWHVGLTIDGGIRIHRLYHIEQGDIHALSSISIGSHPNQTQDAEHRESAQWHIQKLVTPTRTTDASKSSTQQIDEKTNVPHTTTGTIVPVVETAARVASSDSPCPSTDDAVFTLIPGSLKHSIESNLDRCGWSLISWPPDPDQTGYVVDWVIEKPMTLKVRTVNAFLDRIEHSYGIVATRDHLHKTVSIDLIE